MSEEEEADEKKKESVTKEFSSVIDATSNFLKKIFPHAYTLVNKLLRSNKKDKSISK